MMSAAAPVLDTGGDEFMAMPLHLTVKLGTYLMKQKIRRVEKYPLIMELEPLFACNLACAGCGKIQHPASVLKQRMPVEQAVAAVEECGAPMVSIAGGEPLMHPQIHVITEELLKRKKFVVLCTNAVLLPKHIDKFKPNKNFAWMVHLDGIGEKHDEAVSKVGVFDQAVTAIKLAKQKGFQVYTNTTVFNTETPQDLIDTLDYINDELEVDRLEIAPGYAYSKAPDQDRFLGVTQTRELFSKAFAEGRRKKWRFNHSQLYLDFLEGKADFQCTPWGVPLYCLKGWQKPCYLLDDGYAETWRELLEDTDWDKFGRGKDPRCDNCMAHCGYEPTAVLATMSSLKESLRAFVG
jgi:hopanoid biosynthesis associated radical SAM protein HpnH